MGVLSGLTLLSAGLLGGLLVIVVPTLIHLLSRRRARRVRFGPMELLLKSQKRTARSIRLRQLLLLLLRTLFFFVVAAALARPLWLQPDEQARSNAPVAVVVVLDASASMNALLDGKSAFSRARAKAHDAVSALVDDVRTGLVVCAQRPRLPTAGPSSDIVVPTFDRRAVLDAVDAAEVTFAFADLSACIEQAATLAHNVVDENGQALPGERRVVVVSDLAAHAFGRRPLTGELGEGLQIDLLSAFDEEPPPNHGIADVDTGFSSQGLQVRFSATRFGGPDVEVPADLFLDGRRAARLALPFVSGKTFTRVFTAALAPPTTATPAGPFGSDEHSLLVTLGDDALDADNTVELPLEDRAAVRVLVVDGEPDALPLADEVFYLSQALSSSRVGQGGKSRLSITTATPERVDAAALVDIDVVILANVARLPGPAAAALVSHVQAGAGLFLTMGDQVDVDAWNRDLAAVLPAVLRGQKGQALLDDVNVAETLGLTRWKSDHPVLRSLGESDKAATGEGTLAGLSRVRTTTTMLVEPDPQAARQVLAHFTNDAPALVERAVGPSGEGRVLLLTTSIDREWTDLPIRPGFLPLVEQMVLYLGRALDDGRPRSCRIGAERLIQLAGVPAAEAERIVFVVDPAGTEQRMVAIVNEGQATASFTPTLPGLHRPFVVVDGVRRLLSLERFTALIDPRESDLTRVDEDGVADLVPRGAQVRAGFDDEPGTPLWPWLLLAAVLLLLAEGLLLRRSGSA